ncbi:MAG TPA: acetylxylan esterase [Gemmataceae bacterium]|jgi:dienelactone hydrolase|nr:acetylxylan esterase [Gemmataceae bacterium]
MRPLSRRDFLYLSLAASAGLARGEPAKATAANVHQQILDLAARQQERRRARFAAVKSKADLEALQRSLRQTFLNLLDGMPASSGPPPTKKTGSIKGDGYEIVKLVFESFPGYFVSALLYKPRGVDTPMPGILSPCGHSPVGKASDDYQKLHVNLARRGYVVLTYDPVGQGERSQFWDATRGRSRFNLDCGEHAVLGNPLYLLGSSLARYRIWDGMRGIDYLASLREVDAQRIGCVGNSGGGALTAYISALDPRVQVAATCCYITALPRRMANRIQQDPDADPEQDVFGFVSEGVDHAGLLALRVPRPTLVNSAADDFVPIEGTNETFGEVKKLYQVAKVEKHFKRSVAPGKHGLSLPLRQATYLAFDQWFYGHEKRPFAEEIDVKPRPPRELRVCARGQVQLQFKSRPLLPMALEEFKKKTRRRKVSLRELLRLDPELADFRLAEVATPDRAKPTLVVCVNGNESPDWRREKAFLHVLSEQQVAVAVVDPRGVGRLRPGLTIWGHAYGDPLDGVEENIAYNAFLVGKTLLGMRVSDVLAAVAKVRVKVKPARIVLCGRRDAALVACLAAALEPAVSHVAVEEMLLSYWPLFEAGGQPINAASLLPRMLRDFGDIADVLAAIAPRKMLAAAPRGESGRKLPSVRVTEKHFTTEAGVLLDWLHG